MKPLIVFLITFALMLSAQAKDEEVKVLERFWKEAQQQIYPESLADTHFNQINYNKLKKKAQNAENLSELTQPINQFLNQLGVSHTQFYDNKTLDFYFFRSMFGTKQIDSPKVVHIGAQYKFAQNLYVIREVLDGYPAQKAGLRRGDRVLSVNGVNFHPYYSFNAGEEKFELRIKRNGKIQSVVLNGILENPNGSFKNAIHNSAKVILKEGFKIGYIRLWAGTHETNIQLFRETLNNQLTQTDALILDLRGGFGGAWYDYLDPFYPNRKEYFEFSVHSRDGTSKYSAEPRENSNIYQRPMVVLINEGTRSGKEALAYQFKKSNRATVIGTTTKGAFSAGKGIFNDSELPYFLFLSIAEYKLDGSKVEGVGIEPNIIVEYPLDKSLASDPQREAAVSEALRLLQANN